MNKIHSKEPKNLQVKIHLAIVILSVAAFSLAAIGLLIARVF